MSERPIEPQVNPNPAWKVITRERRSACDNRPGLKKIYVTVLDDKGEPLAGAKVRFDTEPSEGIAYDHPNVWGRTDQDGRLEWDHYGIPTRYLLWMEDDDTPLIENIRTDLGNEYCRPGGIADYMGWRPVNRPGIYSYDIVIQRRGLGSTQAPAGDHPRNSRRLGRGPSNWVGGGWRGYYRGGAPPDGSGLPSTLRHYL